MLSTLGTDFGYFSNGKKRWIIAKPNKKEVFKETVINITRVQILASFQTKRSDGFSQSWTRQKV